MGTIQYLTKHLSTAGQNQDEGYLLEEYLQGYDCDDESKGFTVDKEEFIEEIRGL